MAQNEYIYLLKFNRPALLVEGPTEEEAAIRQRHLDYVKGLKDDGSLILAGRTQTAPEYSVGLVIFRAKDEAAAQRIVQSDPAVALGLMTAELYPFPVIVAGQLS